MGREDALRASSGRPGMAAMRTTMGFSGAVPVPSRVQLGGSYFSGGKSTVPLAPLGRPANRAPVLAARAHPTTTHSAPRLAQAPQADVTKDDAVRLEALLGRVIEEMGKRGKDPAGVQQVRDRLAQFLQTAGPQDRMAISQAQIQVLDTSLQDMGGIPTWKSALMIGGVALAVGAAVLYFSR